MENSRILYTTGDRTATITLNRAPKRNALDDVMVKELAVAFASAAKDPAVKVIVLKAAGTAFCAGADLEYLNRVSKFDHEENRADSLRLANLFRLIYEVRKPVIAIVQGPAVAGGCGLASACDFILASREKAQFGFTEVRIGFIPAIVLVFLSKRVGEGKAREMVLRGNVFSADEALDAGLITRVVPDAELQKAADDLIHELLTQNSLNAMGLCKEMLSKLHGMNLMDALEYATNMNAAARMTPDCRQGVGAFLNKEKITW